MAPVCFTVSLVPAQDSRAVIDAKSAQLLVTNKVKELQQAVQDAAAQNAALVNANLIDPQVSNL